MFCINQYLINSVVFGCTLVLTYQFVTIVYLNYSSSSLLCLSRERERVSVWWG
jgi:hypothetical protein